ncbi:MAG: DUF2304 domain-containing protein [Micrococcaceae bacterium]
MRIVFQILLCFALLGVFYFMFRGNGSARSQALRRLAFFFFAVAVFISIFLPEKLTEVAHFFNIGRGTDMLLYGLIIVVFMVIAGSFRANKATERKITTLARRIALDEARVPAIPDGTTRIEEDKSQF